MLVPASGHCCRRWQALSSTHILIHRAYSDAAENIAVKAFRHGQKPPQIVDLQITQDEAVAKFESHQRQQLKFLQASGLLKDEKTASVRAALLPFWMFDITISSEAKATMGHLTDRKNKYGDVVWTPLTEAKPVSQHEHLQHSLPQLQVCASYKHRRDQAHAATGPHVLQHARSMLRAEAQQLQSNPAKALARQHVPGDEGQQASAQEGASSSSRSASALPADIIAAAEKMGPVAIDPPEMRQSIAWQLALRAVKHAELSKAEDVLRQATGADHLKEVQVHVQVHKRSARLVYLPAYIMEYSYGEKYVAGDSTGTIVPELFTALVGGTRAGRVAAELHPSATKVQLTVGGGMIGLGYGLGPAFSQLTGLPALVNLDLVGLTFWSFLVASFVGMMVRKAPQAARNRHVASQVAAEQSFYRQYDARMTVANNDMSDEHAQWLWHDADGRKWEQEEPWLWEEMERQRWAEDIFRQQSRRGVERQRWQARLQQEQLVQEEGAEREGKRSARFGRGHRHGHFSHAHHHQEGGARGHQQQQHGPSHHPGRRRRDFLGYYRMLGVDVEGTISDDVIKAAFKKVAMQLHPDKNIDAAPALAARNRERFVRAQVAYDTLKDSERRRAYDRGQLTQ